CDAKQRTLSGRLEFYGDPGADLQPGRVVVSPRIMRLRDEVDSKIYDVLMVTIEKNGSEHAGYVVGRLAGTKFKVAQPFQRLDYGHDFTRPRITNYTPGSVDYYTLYHSSLLFALLISTA